MRAIDTTPADYKEMVDTFQGETDRGAAVLAGSFVEHFLGNYLKACMTDQSVGDRVFGSNGPLSTFNNRIDVAQAFGFLPSAICADLHIIRKIRNYFAHHPKSASFNHSPVRDWIASLAAVREVDLGNGQIFQLDDPRTAYLVSAGMLMILANEKIHGHVNTEV